MVLADKLIALAESRQDMQQLGNAMLHQSGILTQKDLYELSSHKLSRAITAFEQINDLKRQADALNAQSWLDHKNKDYPAVKTSLLKSAQLALAANDIPRELHALTYLSVMAHKHHQQDDKYLYLQQAENKMKAYQLPIYHFAKVPFHYAIYADNPMDKEPHLERVLVYTELTPNHWVAQSSREQLMEFYIEQGRLEDAQQLITNLADENASNLYIKTLLAKAQQDQPKFIQLAQTTFEQAQLAGDNQVSLDTALLLCENPSTQVNYDFYSQYISQHATVYWRRANEEKLTALNL